MIKNKNHIYFLAFLLPITAIVWRVLYRGYHYVGCEVMAASNGLYLIKNFGFIEAIKKVFYNTRHCQYCGTDGVILNIIPGTLLYFFPWEFWSHLFTFIFSVLSFWLCGVALQIKSSQWALLALALGSSATILSTSVTGNQHMSAILPHALILLIIFHPFFKKNWWAGLLLGLLTIEISWHVYPIGKTIFIPLLLAVFLQSDTTIKKRAVNLFLGIASVFLIHLNNTGRFVTLMQRMDVLIPITKENISKFFDIVVFNSIPNMGTDLIVLPALGLTCLFFLRENRLLFTGMLLGQWALIVILGFHGLYMIRPRRFVLVEFYNIVLILVVFKQWLPDMNKKKVMIGAYALTIILLCGTIVQFMDLQKFTSIDIHKQKFSLPYTFSNKDFFIRPAYEDATNEIETLINKGNKIILVYNYYSYTERLMNPEGIPERLYVKLGHEKFIDSVFIFSANLARLTRVPIIPIQEIDYVLNNLDDVENYLVVDHKPFRHETTFKTEHNFIMQEIENRFVLSEQGKIGPFNIYKLNSLS